MAALNHSLLKSLWPLAQKQKPVLDLIVSASAEIGQKIPTNLPTSFYSRQTVWPEVRCVRIAMIVLDNLTKNAGQTLDALPTEWDAIEELFIDATSHHPSEISDHDLLGLINVAPHKVLNVGTCWIEGCPPYSGKN